MTRPFASPGAQTVDWEERVNPDRLRTYRFGRAQGGPRRVRPRRRPAVRLQQHPLRHEHPHRRVGARQDDPLRAPDARRHAAHLGLRVGRQAPPAQLPVARAGEHPRRHDRPARRRRPGRRAVPARGARDLRDPPGRGRARHAARRRHRRAADGRRARGRGDHRPRRPAGDARRPRGQVDRRDHAAQHGLRRWSTAPTRCIAEQLKPGVRESELVADVTKLLFDLGSEHVDNINAVSGERCSPHPHVFTDRIIRPGDQAFFDIIQTFVGYKTCYYRTFVVGTRHRRPARRLQEGPRVDRRLDRADAARASAPTRSRSVWPKAEEFGFSSEMECFGLQFGHGVGPVPPRAADHQPAQLARASGRDQGGHGHRPRDVLPGEGRLLGRADRGGGRRHRRRAAGHHAASRRRSCSSPTRTEAPRSIIDRHPPSPRPTSTTAPRACTGPWSSAARSRSAPTSCSSRASCGARRHLGVGQEAVAAGFAAAMRTDD